ncbi:MULTISPECIES: tetratricopeptide repeat protein [Streptomyces]|uniref:tetratricopeptide repeat protein n=1 Tax=Streptomyces TaxID=1883 RepID=UPI0007C6FF64|nr:MULTISPECIES: tetratricopeptide repeat protein [unclassified Streptomyces]
MEMLPEQAKRELKRALRDAMSHKGWSPADLARRANLNRNTVTAALSDSGGVPSSETLAKLLAKLSPLPAVSAAQSRSGTPEESAERLHGLRNHAAQRTRAASRSVGIGTFPTVVPCFQDRAAVGELDAALADTGTVVLSQVLVGTGGVGKTQLAAHYAETVRASVDVQVWVTATSRDSVVSTYAAAARAVCARVPEDPELAAVVFRDWLGTTDKRWLLVLDDVAHAAVLLSLWPPQNPSGKCLITTRNRDARIQQGRRTVDVGVYTEDEAVGYVTAHLSACGQEVVREDAAALANDLGHLPLALTQACAYIALNEPMTCREYRARLAERGETLTTLMPHPEDLGDQSHSVAAAWDMSVRAADRRAPAGLARPLLELVSMLDPNGIPAAALTGAPVLEHLTAVRAAQGGREQAPPVGSAHAMDVLKTLGRFSLIDCIADGRNGRIKTVRVHQLIQRAMRETLTSSQRDLTARAAADALTATWPEVELRDDVALAQVLRTNAEALTACAGDALYLPGTHYVLYRSGMSLGGVGRSNAARDHFDRAAETAARHLGGDHPDTLTMRHESARWRGEAGDASGAAQAFTELLTDRASALGDDHPDTLDTRHALAHWRGMTGDAAGAARAFTELLPDRMRVLGPDDHGTLDTRNNVAHWRGMAGDAAGAARAFGDLLPDRIRVQGPDNIDTLISRHNLAHWQGMAGDAASAAAAFDRLLADRRRILGDDHPHTLVNRHNAAHWRGKAGDAGAAVQGFDELLGHMSRVMGDGHPRTFTTRYELARWRGVAGDAAGAADSFERLLADQQRELGEDHPDIRDTREALAHWRGKADGATPEDEGP